MAKILIVALVLFGVIGAAAYFKEPKAEVPAPSLIEVELEKELVEPIAEIAKPLSSRPITPEPIVELAEVNRIEEFFNKVDPRLPIVETITYKSRVAWQKGRPAWLSDYASHYQTSRHFIARSLNGKLDYLKQDVVDGDRFNVLKKDKDVQFLLTIDLSHCKLWFYYVDLDSGEKVLLKTYRVSLGRPDSSKVSGLLTPLGKFSLGSKVATYKPKVMSFHKGEKTEMVRVFGTRWIPFEKEISDCTAPAKGFGLHGVPWIPNSKGELVEDPSSLGKYESDGCIRLATEDIEEIFAIVLTKPTVVELVKGYPQN